MKPRTRVAVVTFVLLVCYTGHLSAATYHFNGEFDGCEHGKLYELVGGGVLECQGHNHFYAYLPEVQTEGRRVIMIGDERVDGYVHDGSVTRTRIDGECEGCEYDKRYDLLNGLVFVCRMYSYSYSYSPEVKIFVFSGRTKVTIRGKEYEGTVYWR